MLKLSFTTLKTFWPECLSTVLASAALLAQGDYLYLKKVVNYPQWYLALGLPADSLLSITLALAIACFFVASLPLVANKPKHSLWAIPIIGSISALVSTLVAHHSILLLSPWSFFFILCNVLWILITVVLPAFVLLNVVKLRSNGMQM